MLPASDRHAPSRRATTCVALALLACAGAAANAAPIGQHSFTWWDDGVACNVTPLGAPPPTANAIPLFHMNEWHLNQADTTLWYNGNAIAGLPLNPFNAANRAGLSPGSVIPVVGGAEAFIYEIKNVNYNSGNGFPPFNAPPYSFTGPVGFPGQNDLSGVNVRDTHGALAVSAPAPGTQFMSSFSIPSGTILDLTPGFVPGVLQDWDFNAHSGAGNFEWDIPNTPGVGAFAGGPAIVFGYAMPGNWLDAVSDGWAHSWNFPVGAAPMQVNLTPTLLGFSGPMIPSPGAAGLLGLGALLIARRRRERAG